MGANPSRIDIWVANTTQQLIKATSALSSAVDLETTGLHSLNRTSDTDVNLIINNVENTRTQAYNSGFPRDINLFFTRGSKYGDMTLSMNAFGENLVSERTDFYNAINNYMTSI